MTTTPVGMRCPECARQRTQVRNPDRRARRARDAPATYALIAVCVVAFVGEIATGGHDRRRRRDAERRRAACSPAGSTPPGGAIGVADGRAVPARHLGVPARRDHPPRAEHVRPLHPRQPARAGDRHRALRRHLRGLGAVRARSGRCCSTRNELTVGASGGIFGLMAAAFLIARHRGLDELASQIGFFVDHQPRLHVQHLQHQHRRPHRRADRRRARGAADQSARPRRIPNARNSSWWRWSALCVIACGRRRRAARRGRRLDGAGDRR